MRCHQDGGDTERCASSGKREPVPQTGRCIPRKVYPAMVELPDGCSCQGDEPKRAGRAYVRKWNTATSSGPRDRYGQVRRIEAERPDG